MDNDTKTLISQYVTEIIAERRRKKRRKPGGPRTDMGALRQLHPNEFNLKIRSAVNSEDGDVAQAADNLDVSTRTLYHYLEDEPALSNVVTTADMTDE